MLKDTVTALRLTSRRVIILLVIAGLIYLIYPRIASWAAPWLQPSASSSPTAVSPAAIRPASAELTRTPTPDKPRLVAQAPLATATPPTASTSVPGSQVETTPFIVTPHPAPTNQATADYLEALATAETLINGPAASPNSPAAPLILPAATGTPTPSPTLISLVIVTETPTPQNIITVAALAAKATAVATTIGTYTPMPPNWVVPIVVIPEPATPIPANTATATFQAAEATALAFVEGTPTPTSLNVWTATPTPFMRLVSGEIATPWVLPSPTPTPPPIPRQLVGKIMFLSNRSGGPQPLPEPLVYVIDPDGSNLALLTGDTFYKMALARDTYSADQRYRTFARDVPRYDSAGVPDLVPAIFLYDYHYNVAEQITFFGAGQAWDPAWSPTQEQIAFVSDDSQHAEIWIVNPDGSDLRRLTETNEASFAREIGKNTFILDEENGHPSWSPDGLKIVYWSRSNGHRQIWIMDADGSNAYSLGTTGYDDWDPVWVKYTDPAREPVFGSGGESSSETQGDTSAQGNP